MIRKEQGEGMAIVLLLLSMWVLPLCGSHNESVTDWTWLYRKNFSHNMQLNSKKKSLFFIQENLLPFTQLVFSWNALRPEEGYFSFYVQIRDAETKKWGLWHHMVDWGKDLQQSYMSKSDGFSSYVYVRLETNDKKGADAFRIKIIPYNNASLSLIHDVFVAASDFNSFVSESSVRSDNSFLKTVHLSDVPLVAQFALDHEDKGRICSPVSCSMVVQYVTGKKINPLQFAVGVFDNGLKVYGSWGCNTAHAFEQAQGKFNFFVRRMNCFADIHQQLLQGMPVVVSVRGNLPGALKPFPHGHLMVVVGWDNDVREVLCNDPAAESNETVFKRYALEDFLRAWECSHRLSYIVQPISCMVGNG